MNDKKFLKSVEKEVEAAREKFPDNGNPHQYLAVLVEEVGEVAKGLNDNEPTESLQMELVQVGAMAMRMATEAYDEITLNKKYLPSNGYEQMYFIDKFCEKCKKWPDDPEDKNQCKIAERGVKYSNSNEESPEEWTYNKDEEAVCTAFERR